MPPVLGSPCDGPEERFAVLSGLQYAIFEHDDRSASRVSRLDNLEPEVDVNSEGGFFITETNNRWHLNAGSRAERQKWLDIIAASKVKAAPDPVLSCPSMEEAGGAVEPQEISDAYLRSQSAVSVKLAESLHAELIFMSKITAWDENGTRLISLYQQKNEQLNSCIDTINRLTTLVDDSKRVEKLEEEEKQQGIEELAQRIGERSSLRQGCIDALAAIVRVQSLKKELYLQRIEELKMDVHVLCGSHELSLDNPFEEADAKRSFNGAARVLYNLHAASRKHFIAAFTHDTAQDLLTTVGFNALLHVQEEETRYSALLANHEHASALQTEASKLWSALTDNRTTILDIQDDHDFLHQQLRSLTRRGASTHDGERRRSDTQSVRAHIDSKIKELNSIDEEQTRLRMQLQSLTRNGYPEALLARASGLDSPSYLAQSVVVRRSIEQYVELASDKFSTAEGGLLMRFEGHVCVVNQVAIDTPARRLRLETEALLSLRAPHPLVMSMEAVFFDERKGRAYLQEPQHDRSLMEWRDELGALNIPSSDKTVEIRRLFRCVLQGLAHLHSHGVPVRGLCPEKVFIEDGKPIIAGYGLDPYNESQMMATQYVSPEHRNAPSFLEMSLSDDVWAAGVMMFESRFGTWPKDEAWRGPEFRDMLTGPSDVLLFDCLSEMLSEESVRLPCSTLLMHPFFFYEPVSPDSIIPLSPRSAALALKQRLVQPTAAKIVETVVESYPRPYARFNIQMECGDVIWSIAYRYSEFLMFHEKLKAAYPDYPLPDFPGKKLIGKSTAPAFLEKRRAALEMYIAGIAKDEQLWKCPESLQFWCYRENYRELPKDRTDKLFDVCIALRNLRRGGSRAAKTVPTTLATLVEDVLSTHRSDLLPTKTVLFAIPEADGIQAASDPMRLFFANLFSVRPDMFEEGDYKRYLPVDTKDCKDFVAIGKAMARCMLGGQCVPLILAPSFYEYLAGKEPKLRSVAACVAQIEVFNASLAAFLRNILASKLDLNSPWTVNSLRAAASLPLDPSDAGNAVVSDSSKRKDIVELAQHVLVECRRPAMDALRDGLFSVPEIKAKLQVMTVPEVMLVIHGPSYIDNHTVSRLVKFDDTWGEEDMTEVAMDEFLRLAGQTALRLTVFGCAGHVHAPEGSPVTITKLEGDVPVVRTMPNMLFVSLPSSDDADAVGEALTGVQSLPRPTVSNVPEGAVALDGAADALHPMRLMGQEGLSEAAGALRATAAGAPEEEDTLTGDRPDGPPLLGDDDGAALGGEDVAGDDGDGGERHSTDQLQDHGHEGEGEEGEGEEMDSSPGHEGEDEEHAANEEGEGDGDGLEVLDITPLEEIPWESAGLIVVDPPGELQFCLPHGEVDHESLIIKNYTDDDCAFKIMVTAIEDYAFSPNVGIVPSRHALTIDVARQEHVRDRGVGCSDRIMVVWAPFSMLEGFIDRKTAEGDPDDLRAAINNVSCKKVKHRIKWA